MPVRETTAPPTSLVRRARKVYRVLGETYPDAHCELDHASPWQLLIATVLSAQSTDRRVNGVTPALFARWPGPAELAGAETAAVEDVVRPTGFFRAKTAAIQRLAAEVVAEHGGTVLTTQAALVALPGVGRKTANVVLGETLGVPGLTVDTHVQRLSRRLGWTVQTDPRRIEDDLAALFVRRDWVRLNHRLIWHGRRRCHARRPACGACSVAHWCPSVGEGPTDPAVAATLVREPRR